MKIIHIVRRYGPVGGMERYVWETTLALAKLGHEVTVICQRCHVEKPAGIRVIELGDMAIRPRWIGSMRFSYRVSKWFKQHRPSDTLVHSNERVNVQQVTTIHGPPFASVRDKPWWKRVSLRVAMQLFLERRELNNAQAIIPNSQIIKDQIAHYYPAYAHKLTEPILPGVTVGAVREPRIVPPDGGVIGFVGHEWKRKGLPFAIKIVEQLRLTRPHLKFIVTGPNVHEIQPLFSAWQGGYELLGWSKQASYEKLDVLLHPALAEPYGMVISEAMAARVPVVISNVCGAAMQVNVEAGEVVWLDAPLVDWVCAVEKQLQRKEAPPSFTREWGIVAREHEAVYRAIFICDGTISTK